MKKYIFISLYLAIILGACQKTETDLTPLPSTTQSTSSVYAPPPLIIMDMSGFYKGNYVSGGSNMWNGHSETVFPDMYARVSVTNQTFYIVKVYEDSLETVFRDSFSIETSGKPIYDCQSYTLSQSSWGPPIDKKFEVYGCNQIYIDERERIGHASSWDEFSGTKIP